MPSRNKVALEALAIEDALYKSTSYITFHLRRNDMLHPFRSLTSAWVRLVVWGFLLVFYTNPNTHRFELWPLDIQTEGQQHCVRHRCKKTFK